MPRLKQQQLPTNFNTFNDLNYSTCQMINSGIDMAMLSTKKLVFNYFDGIQFSLKNNTLTMDRLNDAVARILSVKLALGIAKIRTNENVS
jgi:beta-glucosidase-like glycosyl hydrolase